MQLINALLTFPEDLDFRIHLRNEFLRCGLKKILPVSGLYKHIPGMDSTGLNLNNTALDDTPIVCASTAQNHTMRSEGSNCHLSAKGLCNGASKYISRSVT